MSDDTTSAVSPASPRSGAGGLILIFLGLAVLTGLELYTTGLTVDRAARITVLSGLAMVKGALVLLFFMHLRDEPRALKLTALVPLVISAGFAVVLALDTVARVRGAP